MSAPPGQDQVEELSPSEAFQSINGARAYIRDVIALSTLPAIWIGAPALRIAESLLAVIQSTVRPAVSYIRVSTKKPDHDSLDMGMIDDRQICDADLDDLRKKVLEWLTDHDPEQTFDWRTPDGRLTKICVYPLGFDGEFGVLAAGFEAESHNNGAPPRACPGEYQRTLLNIAANQAITACRNAALQRQAEEAHNQTQALYEVSRALAAELDLQAILQITTDAATRLTGAKFGAFFHNVTNEQGEKYMLFTLSGAPREAFERFGMPRNTPLFDHTFRGHGPMRVDDVLKDPRYGKMEPHHGMPKGHLPMRSYLAVPVVSRNGEVHGGLFFGHPQPGVFSESAERFAVAIASHAAVAIDNAQLFAQAEREIAQRTEAEKTLQENQRQLATLLANLPGMAYRCPAEAPWPLTFVSDGVQALTGRSPEDFTSQRMSWMDVMHPDDLAMVDAEITAAIQEKRIFSITYRICHASGEIRWVLDRGQPVYDAQGKAVAFEGFVGDLTERVRAEEAHRRSEEKYRRLAELLPVALYTCEAPSGAITYFNDHAARLWGRAPKPGDTDQRFCGSFKMFLPDGTHLAHEECPMAVTVREGRQFRNQEVDILRPNGSRITVLVNIDPIRDEHGKVIGAINVFTDTSAQKEAERRVSALVKELREADRRKDEFLATLAHELRNPLAPIRMAGSILKLSRNETTTFDEMTSIIERQSAQLVRLIDDLLDVSRITRGKIVLQKARIDLSVILKQAIETIRPMCEARNLCVTVHEPEQPIVLNADPVRLTQIVGNLLNNSCKYSDPNSAISLDVEREDDHAVIRVTDSGIGIDPKDLNAIFEMFAQVGRSAERAPGGLGIGLSLARSLVHLHGGTIEAHSNGLGTGSQFIVRLPLLPDHESFAGDDGDLALTNTSGCTHRILVVDDNIDALESLAEFLRLNGHDVTTAKCGEEAIAIAEQQRFDVIVLDIGMPGMTGYEVAHEIRRSDWGKNLKLIAMTGWGQEQDKRRAIAAGFDAHLTKPANPELLLQTVLTAR